MNHRRRILRLTAPILIATLLFGAFYLVVGRAQPVQADLVPNNEGDVEIGPDGITVNADPGDVVTFTNWITNTRNQSIEVTITNTIDENWPVPVVMSTDSLTLPGPSSDSVIITVTVPITANAGPVITTVTATTFDFGGATASANNITNVNAFPDMEMTAQDDTLSGDPGQTIFYHMDISNTGNADDTYDIEVAGGALSFPTTSQPTITVSAGESDNFDVSVQIPGDAAADISDTGTVTATSGISSSLLIALNFTTTVESVAGVTIVPDDQSLNSLPGDTVIFTHTVTNTGNETDQYSVLASSSPPNFIVNVDKPLLNLARDASEDVEISVQVAAGTPSDTVNTTAVTVTSTIIDSNVNDTATDETTVTLAAGVDIEKDEIGSGDPGTTVQYVHTITNTGNGSDRFDISVNSTQGWASADPTSIRIPGGESRNVTIDIVIPGGTNANVQDITTVTATSRGNPNVNDSVVDTTTVNLVPNVDIQAAVPPAQTTDPGTTVIYVHTVTNNGNGTDTIDISAVSDQGFNTTTSPSAVTLAKDDSRNIQVSVEIPTDVIVPLDSLLVDITTVTATSRGPGNDSDSADDTTSVKHHRTFLSMVSTPNTWQQVGADSWDASDDARAISVDVCSTNDDLIFAGTNRDVRIFNGDFWSRASGNAPTSNLISGVVLNQACDRVFVSSFPQAGSDPATSGVWQGELNASQQWDWNKLEGGINVVSVRAIVLADGKLFAAGGFGIAYWEDNQWKASSIAAPNIVMDITVADPVENDGPIYAVIWGDRKIYRNVDPGGQPGQFSTISGIDDLPQANAVAVAGDDSNVRYVGTETKHHQLNGTGWVEAHDQGARAFSINGADFAGYINSVDSAPGDGVYFKWQEGGSFVPYNEGWGPPNDVVDLANVSGYLYAATTDGVFLYKQ